MLSGPVLLLVILVSLVVIGLIVVRFRSHNRPRLLGFAFAPDSGPVKPIPASSTTSDRPRPAISLAARRAMRRRRHHSRMVNGHGAPGPAGSGHRWVARQRG